MRQLARWSLRILLLFLSLRAGAFLVHAYFDARKQIENYHYESTFVHFAWRVQNGLDLYPDWQRLPHTNNFFAPLYFWMVGYLGRWSGASIDELFHVSRFVTIGFAFGTTLVVAGECVRRWGWGAGAVGGLTTIGTGPMIYFAVMARPDTMAEFFGVAGFLLATRTAIRWSLAGCVLLALAALTKQNYGIFLIAAVTTLLFARRFKTAIVVFGVTTAALILTIVLATLGGESRLIESYFDEGQFPFAFETWRRIFLRMVSLTPDTLVLPFMGLVLWSRSSHRDVGLATLAIFLLALDVVTVAKTGSDLNYFLNLRCLAGLFAACLWNAVFGSGLATKVVSQHSTAQREPNIAGKVTQRIGWLAAASALATIAVVPGLLFSVVVAEDALAQRQSRKTPSGRRFLAAFNEIKSMAQDPNVKLFSDVDFVVCFQGERAAFMDAFDFRFLVDAGRIRPDELQQRFDSEYYDLILLSSDVNGPEYSRYFKRLPEPMAESVRQHYQFVKMATSLFAYEPRSRPRQ